MTLDISGLSVRELQDRFVNQSRPATLAVLREMRKDPRAAVRRIHQALEKKKEQERQERQRLGAMLGFERVLWRSGVRLVAGVDEAGMGPLAGPVVAAAVVFPPHVELISVDDSKRLDPETRTRLAVKIRQEAVGVGIGLAEVEEVDKMNVYHAGLCAMKRAVENLPAQPEHLLIDARTIPGLCIPQNPFCKGDGTNFSIAAASIVAKVYRDRLMEELNRCYPRYGFARHKGYSTPEHMRAIQKHGPSPAHRKSFRFIDELCGQYSKLFYSFKSRLGEAGSVGEMDSLEEALRRARPELSGREHRKLRLMAGRKWKLLTKGKSQGRGVE